MKNLQDYLSPQYSWWTLWGEDQVETIEALNPEIKPTAENLRIIFPCDYCTEYHVAELKDIKLHVDGDFDFCCPESLDDFISHLMTCRNVLKRFFYQLHLKKIIKKMKLIGWQ